MNSHIQLGRFLLAISATVNWLIALMLSVLFTQPIGNPFLHYLNPNHMEYGLLILGTWLTKRCISLTKWCTAHKTETLVIASLIVFVIFCMVLYESLGRQYEGREQRDPKNYHDDEIWLNQ